MAREEEGSLDEAELFFFAEVQRLINLRSKPVSSNIRAICGVDAHYLGGRVVAVASLFVNGVLAETAKYHGRSTFPYVPGLFYLHEGAFVVQAVRQLKIRPQLVCFDAHGSAHPRSAGLAKTCGVVLRTPSIGIAKSLLVGKTVPYSRDLEKIVHNQREVGFVTRASGGRRYWSGGYSVNPKQLELIVRRYGHICLKAIAESDRLAKSEIRE